MAVVWAVGQSACAPEPAQPPPATPEALAIATADELGYPGSRLTFNDRTMAARRQHGAHVLRAYLLQAPDGTFATTGVTIAPLGTLLTPEMEAKHAAKLAEMPVERRAKFQRQKLPGGAHAYLGGAFGPGGSSYLIVAAWPARGLDLQIGITLSSEDPLKVDAQTQRYHQLLFGENESAVWTSLLRTLPHLQRHAEAAGLGAPTQTDFIGGGTPGIWVVGVVVVALTVWLMVSRRRPPC